MVFINHDMKLFKTWFAKIRSYNLQERSRNWTDRPFRGILRNISINGRLKLKYRLVKWMYSRMEISVGWAAGCLELLLCRWDESSNLLLKTSNNANNHFNNLKSTIIRILVFFDVSSQYTVKNTILRLNSYLTVWLETVRYFKGCYPYIYS